MPDHQQLGSRTEEEVQSQPATWRAAASLTDLARKEAPSGARLAVIGCGTSFHIGRAWALLREAAGLGETDAFVASQFPATRRYDGVVAISRSGTTGDVVRALEPLSGRTRRTVIVGVPRSPVTEHADSTIPMPFADEESVVQTRFATSSLALLRSALGDDLGDLAKEAEDAWASPLPAMTVPVTHMVFLGHGWASAVAEEAALKMREGAGVFSEAYLSEEYRHGPISLAGPSTIVWALGRLDPTIAEAVRATGARLVQSHHDPLVELTRVHRFMLAAGRSAGRDIDNPVHLSRSVVA